MKRILFVLLSFAALTASAATRSWTNTLGGDWFVAANWSPNFVPGAIDTANITVSGTYTVTITAGIPTVSILNLGGASGTQTLIEGSTSVLNVTNAGTIGQNGVLTVNNGGLQGNLTVQPGGQLQLATSATKSLYSLTLLNQGTVTWSGGQLNTGNTPTTVISNGGLWQITGDNFIGQGLGGPAPVWTNSGTLRKSAGTGISQINSFNFVNTASGLVDVLSGTLAFNGSANSILGGSFTATAPGIMSIEGGTWTDSGASASGTGTNRFNGGTLNLRTNIISGLLLTGGGVFITGPTFQQAGAITSLTLDGAFLHGTNRIGSGTLTINSGGADGQTTVQPGGLLSLATTATKSLYSLTLLNQGTVTWSGGQLNTGNTPTTVISNGGLWQITGDNFIGQGLGGPAPVWTNSGTLRKSAGTGISQINSFNFVNTASGLVDVLSGTLAFNGSANSILGGSFTATAPGIMSIEGGTWTDSGASASGTGTNRFNGGTLNLRTNIISGLLLTGGGVFITGPTFQQAGAITSLTLDGAFLHGTNRIGSGTLTINSGGADGQTTVQPGGLLSLATTATKSLYSLTLLNQGTVTWSGGQLNTGNTPTTVISNGGLWQITGDNFIGQGLGGPAPVWTNSGTLRKSAGTGISQINSFNFVNTASGLVDVLSGTLAFNGSANSILGGSFTATAPGIMSIEGGTWTDSGASASGTGTNRFNGGTLNLRTNIISGLLLTGGGVFITGPTFQQAGAITSLTLDGAFLHGTNRIGSGTLTINSGGADGQTTVQPGGLLSLATTATKSLYSLTLLNQGTVTWSGGQLNTGNTPTTVISNGGLWQITGDNFIGQGLGGPAPVWTNSGTLRKSAGTGISQINSFNFVNTASGLVDVLSGTLAFNGSANSILGGSFTATAPGIMSIEGGTWTDSGASASGTGTNRFNGGTLNLRTNIISGLLLTGGGVFITGPTFQQAGAITSLTLDGAFLHGTNRIGSGTLTINSGGADGQTTVQPGGLLSLATTATKSLYSLTLLNQGTVTWSGGQLNTGNTPTTVISNGGLWQITGDNFIGQGLGGPAPVWTNSGTLRKSAGTGISQINSFNFVNQSSGLVQVDTGTLQLPTGTTNSTGILRLNGGALQATGTLTINGGTLDGAGTLGPNLISGGNVSPGQSSAGLIGFNSSLAFRSGATLTLDGTGIVPGSQYDQLSVTGIVAISNCTLQVTALPIVAGGTTFTLIANDAAEPVQGTFAGLPENSPLTVGSQSFHIHYAGGSGNDVVLVRDGGPPAPLLGSGSYSNGTFRLTAGGSSGLIYTIQATTNFLQWTNLGTATGDLNGNFLFSDPNAFKFLYRFYRTTN